MRNSEANGKSAVIDLVVAQSRRVLETYRVDAGLIQEHANNERRIAQGGYGDRQIFELVQNAADEIRDSPGSEIAVVLTSTHLYCANEGSPVTPEGAETILRMSVSRKRGGQIGRFGVGVKSVLAISDTPQFFSKSADVRFGFGFDREWSAEQICSIRPDAGETPVLRMAKPLDPERLCAVDPVLNELFDWAVTVVRLPLKPESVTRLAADLASFPLEFLLFSPHVGTVTLRDLRSGRSVQRQIFQRVESERHALEEVKADVPALHNWRVFGRTHHPTQGALSAAGELHDRPEIDISWAVPERSGSRGTFWAYFPTKFGTTLRGILNAPWKTSEDRQAIFDGNAFNDELIRVAAELVVDSLPSLSHPDDPAGYIDYLPGRGREAPQFADERLTAAIWATAAQRQSLVDQHGVLRKPSDICLHPEDLREEWLTLWREYPDRPAGWVHHSAERRERRARVSLILSRAGRPESSARQWLEALVTDGSPTASALAVRIAAGMIEAKHPSTEDVLRSRIVLTESHGLAAPIRGQIFQRAGVDSLNDDLVYVADGVVAQFGVPGALEILGIREADAVGRFAAVVDQGLHGYSDAQWVAFWDLARAAGPTKAVEVLRGQPADLLRQLKVRTVSGAMKYTRDCMLPGPVVPRDGSRDADVTVDMGFHAGDTEVLRQLQLPDRPRIDQDPRDEPWFADYRKYAWEKHIRSLDAKAHRPQEATMRVDGANTVGPLRFLTTLSHEGRAAFLQSIPAYGIVADWSAQVGKQAGTRMRIMSPFVWIARRHGYLKTSLGLSRVLDAVGPSLAKYARVLPVADLSPDLTAVLGLPDQKDKIPERILLAALVRASNSEDDEVPGTVYAMVLESGIDWPEGMATRCRVGSTWASDVDDREIVVTAVLSEYNMLVSEGVPALLAPTADAAAKMADTWGMLTPSEAIKQEIRYVAESEPVPLLDLYPHLRLVSTSIDGWSLTRCSELEEIIRTPRGIRTTALNEATEDRTVLVLRPADDLALLMAVDRALKLGLGPQRCQSVLDRRKKQDEDQRRKAVRDARSPRDKILKLIGEDRLRAGLPQGLEETERSRSTDVPTADLVADLAINAYGDSVLRHYSKDIASLNEGAPSTFAGSTTSRQFVADLGLPEAYAGSSSVSLPEMEEVSGPSEYPRLHDYQEQVTEAMVELLSRPVPGRGMLRLPTGAGKTRVAVEAVIRVVRTRRLVGPILWIAQSDELCEQAVESWKFVWSKVGPDEKLTVNRFWGSKAAAPVVNNTQLVVATDAKLEENLAKNEYAWLRNASIVIVDEAHRSINHRYTVILEQLGLTRSRTERPLVGLTATPYRGTNEEETHRLIERFGRHRLDDGLFPGKDPYTALQQIGVLAKVDHRELAGSTLTLTESQREGVARFGVLPSSAEEQLGQDRKRNDMLLDEIAKLDAGWPVLVFAASVNHSKLLTAMLNRRGITSAAIDSFTPIAERRRKIDSYRRGDIRVITNYGVLAQGFDAPATRAVVIARPTYSPNVYQQMIGRGLRGPKNGGEETCLILDVRDNIQNYGESLAFTRFEHLWSVDR